jgi:hypothetical protein
MNREIFCEWFKKKIHSISASTFESLDLPKKAVLLLNNAPSHPNEGILKSEDENIFVKYLPPNVTALIQPMDQGVIQNTKTLHRKNCCKN